MSKKSVIRLICIAFAALILFGSGCGAPKRIEVGSPDKALEILKDGNKKYVKSNSNRAGKFSAVRKDTAKNGQTPYAVILTCSDSRVSPEHIFSAGIGDLYVIRTSGNVIGNFELGSIEYAAKQLGSKLVVVMGHSGCEAVAAALEGQHHGFFHDVVEDIKKGIGDTGEPGEAEQKNIEYNAGKLSQSSLLNDLADEGVLSVVQAKYDISNGKVTFFESNG